MSAAEGTNVNQLPGHRSLHDGRNRYLRPDREQTLEIARQDIADLVGGLAGTDNPVRQ
jgi:hypothetical protein